MSQHTQTVKKHQVVVATHDQKKVNETLVSMKLATPIPSQPKEKRDENDIPKLHHVKEDVKRRIQRERNDFGWTQNQLDDKAGIGRGTVAQYESGKAVIDPKIQQKILGALERERSRRQKEEKEKKNK
jgi:ribosome-binding protein aMBF1 (putative translation factor)